MSIENEAGKRMYEFASRIFPYNRSITGEGVRQTLSDISDYIASSGTELKISSVPSGTQVFDWTVPKEWKIREAYIEDERGDHIIDMKESNLHVLGYSTPVDEWVDLDELKKHVYVEENQPDVIPYVTSYYKERYGFCMSKNMLDGLKNGRYHMYIDSELFDGVLNYAEAVIPGESDEEIMFSTYFCHPSMADNECSGPALAVELINTIASMDHRRYTYRFVFVPETIGSITYLSQEDHVKYLQKHLKAGFVLSCVGDDNDYSMIGSRYGNTIADRALKSVLRYIEPRREARRNGWPMEELGLYTHLWETSNKMNSSLSEANISSPGISTSYSSLSLSVPFGSSMKWNWGSSVSKSMISSPPMYPLVRNLSIG